MNPNFEAIGKAFIEHYYKLFDTNRTELKVFYRDDSMLTFEGVQAQGAAAIVEKLVSLKFQAVQHIVTTGDCQPTSDYGIMIHVIGQLKADNDQPHSFSQTFCLKQDPANANNYYCFNDIFRLSLHHG